MCTISAYAANAIFEYTLITQMQKNGTAFACVAAVLLSGSLVWLPVQLPLRRPPGVV